MIRAIDFFIGIILLTLLIPLLGMAVIIKFFTDGFPIFYISKRCVARKRVVHIYKFRTMVNDREHIIHEVSNYSNNGFESIPLSSTVYTSVGRVFERLQIVELPQIINILKGDLSFVGYRPLPLNNIELLEQKYGPELLKARHAYRAGLTGYTQIIGKSKLDPYQRMLLEIKLGRDLYESGMRKCLSVYFKLFIATIFLVVFDKTIFSLVDDVKNAEL